MLVNWLIISVFKGPKTIEVEAAAARAEEVNGAVSTVVGAATVGSAGASTVGAASHV